jgi:hypothetical protein
LLPIRNNHKVLAQSLISWQRKGKKCEKVACENWRIPLEIPLAPDIIVGNE